MWTNTNHANQFQSTLDAGGHGPSKPKRRKIEVACETCRQKKTKCDGARPKCGLCQRRRNVGPTCIYIEPSREALNGAAGIAAVLEAGESESSLHGKALSSRERHSSLQSRHDHGAHTFVTPTSNVSQPVAVLEHQRQSVSQDGQSPASISRKGPSESNWMLKAGLLAASNSAGFFNSIFGQSDSAASIPQDGGDPDDSDSSQAPRTRPVAETLRRKSLFAAEYVLPPRKVADKLLHNFWSYSFIQWIDRIQMMTWVEGQYAGHETANPIDEQIFHFTINIMFGLVYKSDAAAVSEDYDHLSQVHMQRAQKLMQFHIHDLNHLGLLQALLLYHQWLQSLNKTQQCYSNIGLCVLIAQNLGFHLPGKFDTFDSFYHRQMALRAWHGCILMDRITSMISGQPLRISQDVARQSPLFGAIDDGYLLMGRESAVQPEGQISQQKFYLEFCKLHIILGDILTTFYDGRPSLEQINHQKLLVHKVTEIDNALVKWHQDLPQVLHLTSSNGNPFKGHAIHLQTRYSHIRILLYRIFFLMAAEELRLKRQSDNQQINTFASLITSHGIAACVKSATEMLSLLVTHVQSGEISIMPQWWHTVTYTYSAATVLLAAYGVLPMLPSSITKTDLSISIRQAFQILDHYTKENKPAERCKAALTVLYVDIVKYEDRIFGAENGGGILPAECFFNDADLEKLDTTGLSLTDVNAAGLQWGESLETLLFDPHVFGFDLDL